MRGAVGLLRCLVVAASLLAAVSAHAQDRPVVFVHGLQSSGAAWSDTALRLGNDLAIEPHLPNLTWSQPYWDQALGMHSSAVGAIPGLPVAVGHSNGGIVAREWNRIRPMHELVTIGTPHGGAPLMPQFYNWAVFQAAAPSLVNSVGAAFSRWSDWSWILAQVTGSLAWTADFSVWSVVYLGASLGLDRGLPVAEDMRPGSAALSFLNAPANLDRERATIQTRVGIVSAAHKFYWAGPARAIVPNQADAIATALYSTAGALIGWGTHIFISADPMDVHAISQASSLFHVASYLLTIDPFYCSLVSSVRGSECLANDGVVPYDSQVYPGAVNVYLGFEHNDGPAHTQEMRQVDVLADVMLRYLRIPARASAPLPPGPPGPIPPPDDPGPTPPPDDDPGGPPAPGSDPGLLSADERIYAGESLFSANGQYELAYQGDGNLVLYDPSGTPMWASHTSGTAAGFLAMQGDGNLVMYDAAGSPVWANEGSHGHPGSYLVVQNDGNVVVYDPDGVPLWSTGTAQ